MILRHSTDRYLVYLKALGMPAKRLKAYQRALTDIELFYGPDTPLNVFDNAKVLEYAKENDPFDTDPLIVERGAIYCKFIHWLMKNRMIPAWASEMSAYEMDEACERSLRDENQINGSLAM